MPLDRSPAPANEPLKRDRVSMLDHKIPPAAGGNIDVGFHAQIHIDRMTIVIPGAASREIAHMALSVPPDYFPDRPPRASQVDCAAQFTIPSPTRLESRLGIESDAQARLGTRTDSDKDTYQKPNITINHQPFSLASRKDSSAKQSSRSLTVTTATTARAPPVVLSVTV